MTAQRAELARVKRVTAATERRIGKKVGNEGKQEKNLGEPHRKPEGLYICSWTLT